MGNITSLPPPAPPQPTINIPMQRVPALDGASGLHYSGRVYMNQAEMMSKDICSQTSVTPDQITVEMPNSISTPSLPVDDSTKRISATALQGYVTTLVGKKQIPGQLGKIDDQVTADKAFYASVQTEYCYYESRYTAALTQFLNLVADPTAADSGTSKAAQDTLNQAVTLNRRLNSLLEIINFVGNDRAQSVNSRSPAIDSANASLQEKIAALSAQKSFLQSTDVRTKTQEEMMRFSTEKNRAMNIQIMFFVAINVVAIGTVMSVYRSMGPSV
jgi:hypothetical protein